MLVAPALTRRTRELLHPADLRGTRRTWDV